MNHKGNGSWERERERITQKKTQKIGWKTRERERERNKTPNDIEFGVYFKGNINDDGRLWAPLQNLKPREKERERETRKLVIPNKKFDSKRIEIQNFLSKFGDEY